MASGDPSQTQTHSQNTIVRLVKYYNNYTYVYYIVNTRLSTLDGRMIIYGDLVIQYNIIESVDSISRDDPDCPYMYSTDHV